MGFGAVDFVKKPIVVQSFSVRVARAMERAPLRWESWREMSKRMPFYGRTIQPMLVIAQQVLRELDDALAEAQRTRPHVPDLNALVTRVRGAALNVGAVRTVQQLDRLWSSSGTEDEIATLRAALVIELAGFDEVIQGRLPQQELRVIAV
jgi:hypothetical protein